ncbi:hypothetical protein B0I29_111191 [Actinoplanes lutulentus]|uniref:Uncharacterized protein n=1 Tax=Actinoplanes lutulentus TaxID=1287878 RepID=A0A327Z8B1_9ACTN|nr:hypothetical protein B0I29_111191 [Actinoplanes lutulentus]
MEPRGCSMPHRAPRSGNFPPLWQQRVTTAPANHPTSTRRGRPTPETRAFVVEQAAQPHKICAAPRHGNGPGHANPRPIHRMAILKQPELTKIAGRARTNARHGPIAHHEGATSTGRHEKLGATDNSVPQATRRRKRLGAASNSAPQATRRRKQLGATSNSVPQATRRHKQLGAASDSALAGHPGERQIARCAKGRTVRQVTEACRVSGRSRPRWPAAAECGRRDSGQAARRRPPRSPGRRSGP